MSKEIESQKRMQLSDDEIQLVKDTIAKGASDIELKMAIQICNQTGLNPFTKQIYFLKRWDSILKKETLSTQASIDGLRLVALRSGRYGGQTETLWCGSDGKWKEVWLGEEPPAAARVGVYRHGFADPLYAVARFDAYAQRKKDGGLTAMWLKMPDLMIAKCAEALALRKAFPSELSGVYTGDEMGAEGKTIEQRQEQEQKKLPEPPDPKIVEQMKAELKGHGESWGSFLERTEKQRQGVDFDSMDSKNQKSWLKWLVRDLAKIKA